MPIEIKELHIKINVEESSNAADAETQKNQELEKLVQSCVERVMEIIAQKKER